MRIMPAIPESTRSSITLRLLQHAKENWPKLGKLQVTSRAGFAYVTAALPGQEPQPLFRLRYGGSAHSFGFALYSHATGRYENNILATGSPVGTPQEALDTACLLYYPGTDDQPGSEPPTNFWGQPLRTYQTNCMASSPDTRRSNRARSLARAVFKAAEQCNLPAAASFQARSTEKAACCCGSISRTWSST
jgi:hypothetical protein